MENVTVFLFKKLGFWTPVYCRKNCYYDFCYGLAAIFAFWFSIFLFKNWVFWSPLKEKIKSLRFLLVDLSILVELRIK